MPQTGPISAPRLAMLGVLLLHLSFTPPCAWAAPYSPEDRALLQGVRSVSLQVAPLPPEVEALGLRTDQLQTDTEQRLRDAGITVVPHGWYLYPHVTIATHLQNLSNMGTYVLGVVLTVDRPVFVLQANVVSGAPIWGIDFIGRSGETPDGGSQRQVIRDLLDRYIDTCLEPTPIKHSTIAGAGLSEPAQAAQ